MKLSQLSHFLSQLLSQLSHSLSQSSIIVPLGGKRVPMVMSLAQRYMRVHKNVFLKLSYRGGYQRGEVMLSV